MRYMIADPNKVDPRAKLTMDKIVALANAIPQESNYIKATGTDTLTIAAGYVFAIGGSVFKTDLATIGAGNLDTGTAFEAGKTYYVYICDNGSDAEAYKISLSETVPAGFSATNSRKIGKFEFGSAGISGVGVPGIARLESLRAALALLLTPQIFDTPGTYEITVPDGVTKMIILRAAAAGAGGAGAGAFSTDTSGAGADGGGGGAGESIVYEVITVVPGETLTIIIGTGGTGGKAGSKTTRGENGAAGTRTQIIGSASGVILDLAGGNPPGQSATNTAFFLGGFAGGPRGAQNGSTGNAKTATTGITTATAVGGQNLIGIPGVCGSYPYPSRTLDGEDGIYGAGAAGGFAYYNDAGVTAFGNGGDGGDGLLEFVWGVDAA